MIRNRTLYSVLILACAMLALAPGLSAQTGRLWLAQQHFNSNTPRMQAARTNALASRSGTTATSHNYNEGWTSKHTLYVGCTNTPAGSTFSGPTGIQQALAAAQEYTTIKVCAGNYAPGNLVPTPHIAIVGQGPSGAVNISCSNQIMLEAPVNNLVLFEYGIGFASSHDRVKNVTVSNCFLGIVSNVEIGGPGSSVVTDDEVIDAVLNGNFIGVGSALCDGCETEGSEFHYNVISLANLFDEEDRFIGNAIKGNGSQNEEGIVLGLSTETVVKGNTVLGVDEGLSTLLGPADFSDIENNHFNGNYQGVSLTRGSAGNELQKNTANGNTNDGFFADATTGDMAPSSPSPNRFLYNKAYGNGHLDYEDLTGTAVCTASDVNFGTANYYKGNRGVTSFPPGIATP